MPDATACLPTQPIPEPKAVTHSLFPQLKEHTCACGHSPLCRHHHRCKQAEGWRLEQPEPGVLVWHTPAGRTYTTTPTQYAA